MSLTAADIEAIRTLLREELDARLQSERPSRPIGEGGEEPPWDDHERRESGSMDHIDAAEDGEFTSSARLTIEDDARRSIATLLRKQSLRRGSTPPATKRKAGR